VPPSIGDTGPERPVVDLLLAALSAPALACALLLELGARLGAVITISLETTVAGPPRGAPEKLARFVTQPRTADGAR
jgi:hypothetical protein